jgi:pimeloyl-ACP methyl ester carboxylesterase
MATTNRSGVEIYYESTDNVADTPVVFIQGLGAQSVGWRPLLLQGCVERGLRVIRLDNRDCGLSQRMGDKKTMDGGYDVADMAGDVIGVADALQLPEFHVVGQSLGGMIAQLAAINFPDRVRSATFVYTTPAVPGYFADGRDKRPTPEQMQRVSSREEAIAIFIENERFCASPAYGFDEAWIREWGGKTWDRGWCPDGQARQAAAAYRFGDTREGLKVLKTPVAVIHGKADRLIKYDASLEIAQLSPNAELHIYPGMGHELAPQLNDDFIRIIERTVQRGIRAATAG